MEPLNNIKYDMLNNIVESIYKDCVKIDSYEKIALVNRVNNVSSLELICILCMLIMFTEYI